LPAARLLGHGRDARTHLPQMSRNRKKQWAGAGDDDALAGDRVSAARQRLQTARTEDARQGPTGEGQKAFARACGEHKAFVREISSVSVRTVAIECAHGSQARCVKDTPSGEDTGAGGAEHQ